MLVSEENKERRAKDFDMCKGEGCPSWETDRGTIDRHYGLTKGSQTRSSNEASFQVSRTDREMMIDETNLFHSPQRSVHSLEEIDRIQSSQTIQTKWYWASPHQDHLYVRLNTSNSKPDADRRSPEFVRLPIRRWKKSNRRKILRTLIGVSTRWRFASVAVVNFDGDREAEEIVRFVRFFVDPSRESDDEGDDWLATVTTDSAVVGDFADISEEIGFDEASSNDRTVS